MKLHEIMKEYFLGVAILLLLAMPSFGFSLFPEKLENVVLKNTLPQSVSASCLVDASNAVSNVVDKVIRMLPEGVSAKTTNLLDKATRMLRISNPKVAIILLVLTVLVAIISLSTLIAKIRRWAFLRSLDKEDFL